MRLGIMQPYFMPYLGYLSLINQVDQFILFDTPQFIRHGWIERNRILKLDGEPMLIKVPLIKHSRITAIQDIEINNSLNWKDKILAQIVHYKKKAPYYNEVRALLEEVFKKEIYSITKLNAEALDVLCKKIEINTPIKIWSEMGITIEPANAPDEWALNICKAMGADQYLNPPGGQSFFDRSKYESNNIEISFIEWEPKPYKQFDEQFVPFLSVIDALMFCQPSEIKEMLNNYILK